MNSNIIPILIWERWRRTRWSLLAAYLLPSLNCLFFSIDDLRTEIVGTNYIVPMTITYWYFGYILLTVKLLIGHSETQNLDLSFPKRLFRLPIRTGSFLAVYIGYGAAVIALLFLLSISSMKILGRSNGLEWSHFLWFETVYIALQTLSWLGGSVRLLNITFPLVGLIALFILPDNLTELENAAIIFSIIILLCFVLSFWSVSRYRYGDWLNNGLWEVSFFNFLNRRISKPFKSALQAQIWFEFRRTAYLFPLLVLCTSIITLIQMTLGLSIFDSQGNFILYSYASMSAIIAGLITYALLHRDRVSGASSFLLRHPMDTGTLATARLLAVIKGIIFALIIIITFSLVVIIFDPIATGSILLSKISLKPLSENYLSKSEFIFMIALGLYGIALLIWVMLRLGHILIIGLFVYLFVYTITFFILSKEVADVWIFNCLIGILFFGIPIAFFIAKYNKLITTTVLVITLCFFSVLIVVLWNFPAPEDIPEFIKHWPTLKILTIAMVPFIPIVATPLWIHRMRHR